MTYILSYELCDNPGYEYEEEIPALDIARSIVDMQADYLLWYCITTADGAEINIEQGCLE